MTLKRQTGEVKYSNSNSYILKCLTCKNLKPQTSYFNLLISANFKEKYKITKCFCQCTEFGRHFLHWVFYTVSLVVLNTQR